MEKLEIKLLAKFGFAQDFERSDKYEQVFKSTPDEDGYSKYYLFVSTEQKLFGDEILFANMFAEDEYFRGILKNEGDLQSVLELIGCQVKQVEVAKRPKIDYSQARNRQIKKEYKKRVTHANKLINILRERYKGLSIVNGITFREQKKEGMEGHSNYTDVHISTLDKKYSIDLFTWPGRVPTFSLNNIRIYYRKTKTSPDGDYTYLCNAEGGQLICMELFGKLHCDLPEFTLNDLDKFCVDYLDKLVDVYLRKKELKFATEK